VIDALKALGKNATDEEIKQHTGQSRYATEIGLRHAEKKGRIRRTKYGNELV